MIKGNAGDEAARSCFHTQASSSRSVIDAVVPPGGGSKQIAEFARVAVAPNAEWEACRLSCSAYLTTSPTWRRGSLRDAGGDLAADRLRERGEADQMVQPGQLGGGSKAAAGSPVYRAESP
jgi:hypothetical protein